MSRPVIALGLVLATLTGCVGGLPSRVIYPSITLDETVTEDHTVSTRFVFEGRPVEFTLAVDGSLYAGAAAATKSVTRFGRARENDWIEDYYPAFVDEPAQEPFFAELLGALRAVRDERGLDADRYAELLTVFAQSVAYGTDPVDLSPKFPVETFVEGEGDCDDKTLLLAALLAREGYDVAILLFESEQHVSLGIRSEAEGYAGTGYEFVETTAPAFVGMVPDEFAGGLTLTSTPRVFRIGEGTRPFTAADEVRAILEGRERIIETALALADELTAADAELTALQQEVADARSELESLQAAGDAAAYNERVAPYNRLVDRYNAAAAARNDLAERYNRLTELERAIVEGLDDRAGTYALVAAAL
jgi:hypothetical protein